MVHGPHSLLKPVLYMFLALLSLNYFRVAYSFIIRCSESNFSHPIWRSIAPYLKQTTANLLAGLGPPESMHFTLTHVLLAAILLCLTFER